MITLDESVPAKNLNYLLAEDIFYQQFNQIEFYIEDAEQENFYFCILKKLFPNIKLEKIFPLNGKVNVVENSRNNIGNNKKVYLVDLDFDDILGKVIIQDNLFYLDRYSIENFLFEEEAFIEYIISEKPQLKRNIIKNIFNIEDSFTMLRQVLAELIILHLIVQKSCSSLKNISLNHQRFFSFNNSQFYPQQTQFNNYKTEIELELAKVDKRLRLSAQIQKANKQIILNSKETALKHIPGKYLLKMIKQIVESLFGLVSRNTESFSYRIADKCSFKDLEGLKLKIDSYIK